MSSVPELPPFLEAVAKAPLIAIGRSGFAAPPGSTITGLAMPEVSATQVRDLVRTGGDAGALLPRDVLGYIATHDLYRQ